MHTVQGHTTNINWKCGDLNLDLSDSRASGLNSCTILPGVSWTGREIFGLCSHG